MGEDTQINYYTLLQNYCNNSQAFFAKLSELIWKALHNLKSGFLISPTLKSRVSQTDTEM